MKKVYIPTIGEERANAISHGAMAAIVLLLIPFGSVLSYLQGGAVMSLSVSIYMISIFAMTLVSTLYHSMGRDTRDKEVLHVLDHIFIYVAIAGSYTPVALSVIGGWRGISITILQWVMVVVGVLYKTMCRRSIPALSLTIYLTMGWSVVIYLPELIRNGSSTLLTLIVAGGLFYTVGAVIYARKGFKYHHLVWHLMINIALLLHLTAILLYI
ncbi:MAG: hemolysin III family protein [Rikenellaceae bacterium]